MWGWCLVPPLKKLIQDPIGVSLTFRGEHVKASPWHPGGGISLSLLLTLPSSCWSITSRARAGSVWVERTEEGPRGWIVMHARPFVLIQKAACHHTGC